MLPKPKIFNGKTTLKNLDDLIDFTDETVEHSENVKTHSKMDKNFVNESQLQISHRCKQVLDALKNVLLMNSGIKKKKIFFWHYDFFRDFLLFLYF